MSLALINKWAPSGKEKGLIESDLSNRQILAHGVAFFREPTFSLPFNFSQGDPVGPVPGPSPAKIS